MKRALPYLCRYLGDAALRAARSNGCWYFLIMTRATPLRVSRCDSPFHRLHRKARMLWILEIYRRVLQWPKSTVPMPGSESDRAVDGPIETACLLFAFARHSAAGYSDNLGGCSPGNGNG